MKVTKLHIDDYKVFKDFDIDFTDKDGKAQNLIVLAGINGTGKTTLLEFINNVLYKRYTEAPKDKSRVSYIVVKPTPEFINYNLKRIDFFYNPNILSITPDRTDLHFFKVKDFDFGNQAEESEQAPPPDFNKTEVGIVKMYIDKYIYDPKPILSSEVYLKLRNFIDSIFADFLLGFKFKRYSSNGEIFFETLSGLEIALRDLSTGERQILNFALRLFVADIKDSVILIDEPEFSLHPSWQNKIVGVLQKYADEYNCQVILATHSPQIIGSVHPQQLRLLYKDESGTIKVKDYIRGSYGWPVDKILVGLMDVNDLRTPEVVTGLNELNELVRKGEYNSDEFKSKMQNLEDSIGADDEFLTAPEV